MILMKASEHVLPAGVLTLPAFRIVVAPSDSDGHAFEAQDGQDGKTDFVVSCKISMTDELKIGQ